MSSLLGLLIATSSSHDSNYPLPSRSLRSQSSMENVQDNVPYALVLEKCFSLSFPLIMLYVPKEKYAPLPPFISFYIPPSSFSHGLPFRADIGRYEKCTRTATGTILVEEGCC